MCSKLLYKDLKDSLFSMLTSARGYLPSLGNYPQRFPTLSAATFVGSAVGASFGLFSEFTNDLKRPNKDPLYLKLTNIANATIIGGLIGATFPVSLPLAYVYGTYKRATTPPPLEKKSSDKVSLSECLVGFEGESRVALKYLLVLRKDCITMKVMHFNASQYFERLDHFRMAMSAIGGAGVATILRVSAITGPARWYLLGLSTFLVTTAIPVPGWDYNRYLQQRAQGHQIIGTAYNIIVRQADELIIESWTRNKILLLDDVKKLISARNEAEKQITYTLPNSQKEEDDDERAKKLNKHDSDLIKILDLKK